MGNTPSYEYPCDYPECEKIHNLFKGPEDYNKNHANSVMIRNGDPEYVNVIVSRYKFKGRNENINAYTKDVLSGWDHWKFPVEPGKAKISIEILKTMDKCFLIFSKCNYVLDFNYFNQKIKDKVEMDTEFIEICIDNLTNLPGYNVKTTIRLEKQVTYIDEFLEEWESYSTHYYIRDRLIYNKIKTLCNDKKIKISNLIKDINKKEKKERKNSDHDPFDFEYYREIRNQQDDDEEDRRRQEEEKEEEIEEEREDYDFYYEDD